MTERPIVLKAEQVRSVLDGRKTQHRIPVKFPFFDRNMGCELAGNELAGEIAAGNYLNSKFGKPGDRMWVRETFGFSIRSIGGSPHRQLVFRESRPDAVHYYDCNGVPSPMKWTPSCEMPRWASRITLEITGVRVERLAFISEQDAVAEGVPPAGELLPGDLATYLTPAGDFAKATVAFQRLSESVHGPKVWKSNPWVWVIEFKRVEAANG